MTLPHVKTYALRFRQTAREVASTLAAVVFFSSLMMILAGAPPLEAYYLLLKGSLGSWTKFSHVVKAWIPLTLCACGLVYTFRINLWNIGIEGQMMMGAIFTTWILRMGLESSYPMIMLGISFVFAAAGGALWALLAGTLKIKGGVNEIFAGLGLNFVSQGIILWLIFGPWKRPGIASMSGTELFPARLWLPYHTELRIAPMGVLLTFAAILITALVLRYTRIGINLKAVGRNAQAAYLYGLKPGRSMLIALVCAGAFAGLAGALQVSGVYHRLLPAISSSYGYMALLVVMLSKHNIWLTPAIAFFFACLNVGSIQLPMVLQLDSSLSGVLQGAFVLAALAVQGWRYYRLRNHNPQNHG